MYSLDKQIDLHNLFRFLALRMDSHAQKEIQDYATAMFALIQPTVPVAAQAFLDYTYGGVSLTRLEIEALKTGQPLNTTNKREATEWEEKKKRFGLDTTETTESTEAVRAVEVPAPEAPKVNALQ